MSYQIEKICVLIICCITFNLLTVIDFLNALNVTLQIHKTLKKQTFVILH